ncbi:MAG TPA: hypothetical protein VLS86_04455, partial [Acidimicrobiia bacterium]|nr:hypothetical protein [Acidimicrobiia bacterium]
MTALLVSSIGLVVGGPFLAVGTVLVMSLARLRIRRLPSPSIRPVLLVLLVELRAGRSTLAAIQEASAVFPKHRELAMASRLATVKGLTGAVEECHGA